LQKALNITDTFRVQLKIWIYKQRLKTGDIRKGLKQVNQTAKVIIVFKSANTIEKNL
jgi:hypothetical protein